MTECIHCHATVGQRPLFRTNPHGQADAGWACGPCIDARKIAAPIDDDTRELAELIHAGINGPDSEDSSDQTDLSVPG